MFVAAAAVVLARLQQAAGGVSERAKFGVRYIYKYITGQIAIIAIEGVAISGPPLYFESAGP